MPKDRTARRRGPQLACQPSIDTSILHGGRKAPVGERATENKHGVPRDVPGKTPGGRDRHHCPQSGHSSDLQCLKKGCMIKCGGCGIRISRYSGAKCRACAARETGRLREEKAAREAQRKTDAKLFRKGKPPVAKAFLAPHAAGVRKRTGRVGQRALDRSFRRRSYDTGHQPPGSQLSDEGPVDRDEMVEDEDEWEDMQEDVDRQDCATEEETRCQQLTEEDAALQHKIRESLLKLMS